MLLEILTGLAMMAGLVFIVLPILPGLIIVVASVLVWALITQSVAAWVTLGVAVGLYIAGVALQYLIPGKRLKNAGVSNRTLLIGLLLGIVGFFVIPVVGFFIGFPLGVYVAESGAGRSQEVARANTVHALKAMALNIGIELVAGVSIFAVWLGVVFFA